MKLKRIVAMMLCVIAALNSFGCSSDKNEIRNDRNPESLNSSEEEATAQALKYVFLFIGDGMSYPQFQLASDYLGAMADGDYMGALPSLPYENRTAVLDGPVELNFMSFEEVGTAVTFDSCSFAPDSAAAGTAIASGYKTYSNAINMDESRTICFESIAEKIHKQLGWKVGIISSANINHATPAAFYAHQPTRNNYYEIGEELILSGFEYFAGGGFRDVYGAVGDKRGLYDRVKEAGYVLAMTREEAEALTADSGKAVVIDENLADTNAMKYEIDRNEDEWSLADHVEKGIEVLDNETGFFMMCEGGKIDWACHANDAGTIIHDVLAFSEAVQVAIDFATEHPEETLIVVTGDHETGGLAIGYAETNYDTYLTNYSSQKISFQKYMDNYITSYKEEGVSFEKAMDDVEELFGLKVEGKKEDRLLLTAYEIEKLKTAYELSMEGYNYAEYTQEQKILYGTYDPFTVTITHILSNKSGVDFTSYNHTGLPVAVFADGVGAESFDGYYDNTEIFKKFVDLLDVK